MKRNSLYNFFNKNNDKPNSDRLPSNRFKAYFDIIRNRFGKVILLSLITTIFFLPLIIFSFFWNVYSNYSIEQFAVDNTDQTLILFQKFSLISMQYLFSAPLFIIGFIGLGGTFYVSKKMVFQEGDIFLWSDFFFGVKSNIKSSLLSGICFSVYFLICFMNIYFYPIVSEIPFALKIVLIILLSIILVFVTSFCLFVLASASIYQFKFMSTVKNNALLAAVLFPLNILMCFLSLFFFIGAFLLPYIIVQSIFLLLIILFGFSHLAISFNLYAFKMFDKHINIRYSQVITNKGLDKGQKEE